MAVTVLGWLFIGFGAFAVVGGFFGMLMSWVMPFPPADLMSEMADAPRPFQLMFGVLRYFGVIAAAQLVVGAVMIWSGVAFLRLRPWARAVLEGIMWLAVLYTVAFGGFWVWMVHGMWRQAPRGAEGASSFFPVFIAMGVMSFVVSLVPLGAILYVLRGRTVRGAFRPG